MWRACLPMVIACGAAIPPVPSQGGPPWRELSTEHFTLWTDASAERGRQLVDRMEHLRSIEFGAAFPDLPIGGRTLAIAFRNESEGRSFTPPDHPAFAIPAGGNVLRQPVMVFYADAHGDDQTVTHELTHAISYNAMHYQPRWFAEGLATFFENLKLDVARGTVEVGKPPENFVRVLETQPLLPAATLFACASLACADVRFYITAWTLFTYLHNKQPAALAELEKAFDLPGEGWRRLVTDPAELDRELGNFLLHGGAAIFSYKLEPRAWPVTERALGDADVYAMRAMLHVILRPTDPAVATEVAAALALDPTEVLANVLDIALRHHDLTPEQARAITAAHPDDWEAWSLLANATRGEERHAAHVKMCALAAQNPAILLRSSCAGTK